MSNVTSQSGPSISVVVPLYNEQDNVEALLARLMPVLQQLDLAYEVVAVDDGSTDATAECIENLGRDSPALRLVRLSRNFGHQAALFAGLEHARGKAIVAMDGDLQHPPELIRTLVSRWQEGYEVVQAVRRAPADESALKRAGSRGFYSLLSRVAKIQVTPGAADFRLLSREALNAFLICRERCRFNRGLVQWIGFRAIEVPYEAERRRAGRSK